MNDSFVVVFYSYRWFEIGVVKEDVAVEVEEAKDQKMVLGEVV